MGVSREGWVVGRLASSQAAGRRARGESSGGFDKPEASLLPSRSPFGAHDACRGVRQAARGEGEGEGEGEGGGGGEGEGFSLRRAFPLLVPTLIRRGTRA